jgi:hypothetical protein
MFGRGPGRAGAAPGVEGTTVGDPIETAPGTNTGAFNVGLPGVGNP